MPNLRLGLGKVFSKTGFYTYLGLMVLWFVFPIFLIVYASFQGTLEINLIPKSLSFHAYQIIPPTYWESFFFSLWLSVLAAVVSVLVAAPASWAMVRGKLPGKNLLSNIVLLPILIPKIVIAIALLRFFLPLHLTNNFPGLLIALVGANGLPLAFRYTLAVAEGINGTYEEAAQTLGAGKMTVFGRIVLPLMGPGIIVSALFVFMSNLMSFLIIFFIAGPMSSPISVRLFNDIVERGALPHSIAMSAILIFVAILFYVLISVVLGPAYFGGVVFAKKDA